MVKFIIKIVSFLFIGYFIGEAIIRIYKLDVDVQNVYVDSSGLIKNEPNQTGHYLNGNQWVINKYGEFGYQPKSLDSVITVIGDSYIENIMNPPTCHQANFLASMTKNVDFYPCARSGASFIEFVEMAKSLQKLNPIKQLLYVHHGDFTESVKEIKNNLTTVQLELNSNKIIYAKLTQSKFKKILYNFKFAYYLYRNYFNDGGNVSTNNRDDKKSTIDYKKIRLLLKFVKSNYNIEKIVLVFSPDSDLKLIELAKQYSFETVKLTTSDYKSWQLTTDSHWSCYGHEQAALQVAAYLNKKNFQSKSP